VGGFFTIESECFEEIRTRQIVEVRYRSLISALRLLEIANGFGQLRLVTCENFFECGISLLREFFRVRSCGNHSAGGDCDRDSSGQNQCTHRESSFVEEEFRERPEPRRGSSDKLQKKPTNGRERIQIDARRGL